MIHFLIGASVGFAVGGVILFLTGVCFGFVAGGVWIASRRKL